MGRYQTCVFLFCAVPLACAAQKPIFEPNLGQAPGEARWLVRGGSQPLRITGDAIVARVDASRQEEIAVRLHGAAPLNGGRGVDATGGHSNYFRGNDPRKWRTDVPHYRAVRFNHVYDGIDMVLYADGRDLEFDLVVQPGADPGRIRFAYDGVRRAATDAAGDLTLTTAKGNQVRQRRPHVYQDVSGERREIAAAYELTSGRRVAIRLGPYDATVPLVVDPVLVYATYLGGMGEEQPGKLAVDDQGNAYVLGASSSYDYPTRAALQTHSGDFDLVVSKLAPGGNDVLYSTYIGGAGWDMPGGIAVDKAGYAFVTAATRSTDFPTASALQKSHAGGRWDAVALKLAPGGNALAYSTYLGGALDDEGVGIALDSTGSAYIAGYTESPDFPIVSAYQRTVSRGDIFVAKLSPSGDALQYSTYVGGEKNDWPSDIAVDASGAAYVLGISPSTQFPTVSAMQPTLAGGEWDLIVFKLAPSGRTLEYSTYIGTPGREEGGGIAVDAAGSAFISGAAYNPAFPTVPAASKPAKNDAYVFVAKLAPEGNRFVYSVLLGGSGGEFGADIALDGAGNAWIAGGTYSRDFPVISAEDSRLRGPYNAFLASVGPTGALRYSRYFGSSRSDSATGVAIDGAGFVYVAGLTSGKDLPTMNAFQSTLRGEGQDLFVAKFAPVAGDVPAIWRVANAWSDVPYIADSGWAYIKGANLAATTRAWREDDILEGQLPEALDGVSVTVNGRPAHIHYVSPAQINIQVPDDGQTGSVPVQVKTSAGTSAIFTVQKAPIAPAVFKWPAGVATVPDTYAGAVAIENGRVVYIGLPGLLAPVGIATRPARPGEVVVLFLTGCGPTMPATPAGVVVGWPTPTLANSVEARINGFPAEVAGNTGYLIFPGECQLNVTVPTATADGNLPVEFAIGGVATQSRAYITVAR